MLYKKIGNLNVETLEASEEAKVLGTDVYKCIGKYEYRDYKTKELTGYNYLVELKDTSIFVRILNTTSPIERVSKENAYFVKFSGLEITLFKTFQDKQYSEKSLAKADSIEVISQLEETY